MLWSWVWEEKKLCEKLVGAEGITLMNELAAFELVIQAREIRE